MTLGVEWQDWSPNYVLNVAYILLDRIHVAQLYVLSKYDEKPPRSQRHTRKKMKILGMTVKAG